MDLPRWTGFLLCTQVLNSNKYISSTSSTHSTHKEAKIKVKTPGRKGRAWAGEQGGINPPVPDRSPQTASRFPSWTQTPPSGLVPCPHVECRSGHIIIPQSRCRCRAEFEISKSLTLRLITRETEMHHGCMIWESVA